MSKKKKQRVKKFMSESAQPIGTRYFISYVALTHENHDHYFANRFLTLDKKILNEENILNISEMIKKENHIPPIKEVVILSFIEMNASDKDVVASSATYTKQKVKDDQNI